MLTLFDDLNVMTGTTLIEAVTDDHAYLNGALTNYGVIRKTQPIGAPAQYYFGLAGAYAGAELEVDAAEPGTLTALRVDRIDGSPADAPGAVPLYWQITPIGGGYNVTMTLPHAELTNPSACRRTAGSSWECVQSAFDATTVTRRNVTAFSDWAVFDLQPTTTTLASGPNPAVIGQTVVFTATVTPVAPGAGTPAGNVTFKADGSAITGCNPLPLTAAQASCTTSVLAAGDHAITAEYMGDATFLGSTAPAVHQVVQPLPIAVNDAAGTQQATPVTVAVLANDINPAGGELVVAEITTPAGHGAAEIAQDGKSVLYTPAEGFAGLDSFVYVARDKNGNTDDALAAIVVTAKSQTDEPPQIEAVNPLVDSTKPFTSPNAGVEVQLPAGFFTGTLTEKDILFLSYTAVVTPTEQTHTPPGNLRFGNFEFDLTLFLNNEPQHGAQFALSPVLSPAPVHRTDQRHHQLRPGRRVRDQGGFAPVYYWNGSAWAAFRHHRHRPRSQQPHHHARNITSRPLRLLRRPAHRSPAGPRARTDAPALPAPRDVRRQRRRRSRVGGRCGSRDDAAGVFARAAEVSRQAGRVRWLYALLACPRKSNSLCILTSGASLRLKYKSNVRFIILRDTGHEDAKGQ